MASKSSDKEGRLNVYASSELSRLMVASVLPKASTRATGRGGRVPLPPTSPSLEDTSKATASTTRIASFCDASHLRPYHVVGHGGRGLVTSMLSLFIYRHSFRYDFTHW